MLAGPDEDIEDEIIISPEPRTILSGMMSGRNTKKSEFTKKSEAVSQSFLDNFSLKSD